MLLASGRCFAIPSDRRRCGGSRRTLCEDGGSHEPPSHGTNGTLMMICFVIIDPLELGHLKKIRQITLCLFNIAMENPFFNR